MAIKPASLFDEQGLGANWAPATMAGVRRGYGRWLLWLSNTGGTDPQILPADRVNQEAVARYVTFLRRTTADSSVSTYVSFLHMAVRAMAPDGDWAWMKRIYMRLKRDAPAVRPKRNRIRSSKLLFQLGIDLMEKADSDHGPGTWAGALQFRDGLIVSLLAIRPLRTKNFLDLILGETLIEQDGAFWISIDRNATKSKAPIEQPFPPPLAGPLRRYIEQVRPFLMARRRTRTIGKDQRLLDNHLWISKEGSLLSRNAFFDLVCRRTSERFGHAINPHLFRHCLATTIATETPNEVGYTRRLLGHATALTSERHYNYADGHKASRLVQQHILALRRIGKGKKP